MIENNTDDAIVYYREGFLVLDTGMTESTFSKARLADRMSEKGFIVRQGESGWKFDNWTFEENETDEVNHDVLWKGRAFKGLTLKNYIEGSDRSFASRCVSCVITVIEEAVKQNIDLYSIGAGGIYVASDFRSVIFLPYNLFRSSVSCRSVEINTGYNEFYLHENLRQKAALRFTQCVISYYAITGKFPYDNTDAIKRHEDLFDHNYMPLSDVVYGIDESLSTFVDSYLSVSMPKIQNKGNNRAFIEKDVNDSFPVRELNKELGLNEDGTLLEGNHLNNIERKSSLSFNEFTDKASKKRNTFIKRLKCKRWFRHNRTFIAVAGAVAVVFVFFVMMYKTGSSSKPTTESLDSIQTLSMFYSAMNLQDVDSVGISCHGKDTKNIMDIISNFYVSGKALSVYDSSQSTVSPASWFCFNYDGNYRIFGLTKLKIDGEEESLYFKGPAKNTRGLKPLVNEAGRDLHEGDTISHQSEFYMLYSEDGENLHVLKRSDNVTLTWIKNRWVITSLESKEEDSPCKKSSLYTDYSRALVDNGGDIDTALRSISDKYQWLPTEREILECKDIQ